MAGRERYEEWILGITVVDRVGETAFSRMYRESVGEPPPPSWRPVAIVMRGICDTYMLSPLYSFTEIDAHLLVDFLSGNGNFSPNAKKAVILKFLSLLEQDPFGAHDYVGEILGFAAEWKQAKTIPIEAGDLPQGSGQTRMLNSPHVNCTVLAISGTPSILFGPRIA